MSNEIATKASTPEGTKLPSWLILVLIVAILGFSWWQNNHTTQTKSLKDNELSSSYVRENHSDSTEILDPPDSEVGPGREATENVIESEVIAGEIPSPPVPGAGTKSSDSKSSVDIPSIRVPNENRLNDSRTNPTPHSDHPRASGPLSDMRTNPSKGNQAGSAKTGGSDRQQPTEKSGADDKPDATAFQIKNQTIRDLDGRVVYKGTIDLKPTLDRIGRGEANRHRNDGTTFQNRENRLPRKPAGYYKEYVNPTPGENGPGPQRIIIGKEDEVWYTPDHYKTFKQIK